MAAPSSMAGMPTTVTVDGTDLHTYGMVVNQINNPVPAARTSSVQIFGKDGDFDFTKNYEVRIMTIVGKIQADSHADLLTYIDALQEFFRLRKDGTDFQVIFQNQADRYWTCKYQGQFSITAIGSWMLTHQAAYTLVLKCVWPYAEAVNLVQSAIQLHSFRNRIIDYAGSVAVPLDLAVRSAMNENLLEKAGGDVNEDHTLWTKSNCTGSNDAGPFYGTYRVRMTRTAGGAFYAEIDVSGQISTSKYYVFCVISGGGANRWLQAVTNGAGGTVQEDFYDASPWFNTRDMTYLKIGPTELSGATSVKFRVYDDGTASDMYIDAGFIYEITQAEYNDSAYCPPPYVSDPTGDDMRETQNPLIRVSHGANIQRNGNGDDDTDWDVTAGTLNLVTDPLDASRRCFLVADSTDAWSPEIYLTAGFPRKLIVSFEVYQPIASGASAIRWAFYRERQAGGTSNYAVTSTPWGSGAVISTWTQQTAEWDVWPEFPVFRIWVQAGAGSILYLRKIMVSEHTTESDTAPAFDKYSHREISVPSTTLDNNDIMGLNSYRMNYDLLDYSTKAAANAADKVTAERLLLEPGTNLVSMKDSRLGSATPHTASGGALKVELTYRPRYL